MPRSRHTPIEKLALISDFERSGLSAKAFGKQHELGEKTIKQWLLRYQRDGISGLTEASKNQHYSQQFKINFVQAYLNGDGTFEELSYKNGLRSRTQLQDWIIQYNRDQTVTASPSRKQVPTMSRKTTFKERIEIVEWITKEDHSYSEAAEHFNVSYQQARLWALKAKEKGYEALVDKRGHHKSEAELTDIDKANLRIRQLESQIKDQKLLGEFVKKYQELQHRG